jgi:hypothetical protein
MIANHVPPMPGDNHYATSNHAASLPGDNHHATSDHAASLPGDNHYATAAGRPQGCAPGRATARVRTGQGDRKGAHRAGRPQGSPLQFTFYIKVDYSLQRKIM